MRNNNGNSKVSRNRTEKKMDVQKSSSHENGGGHRAAFIAIAVALIVILGSVVAYYVLAKRGSDDGSNDAQDNPPDTGDATGGGVVKLQNIDNNLLGIPLAQMNRTAKFFKYNISGAEVQFFAVTDANGTIHTALNACPKCYKKHAGFRQQGDKMLELCCMMTFSIDRITAEGCNITGCHPAYLKTTMNESMLKIAKSDLAAGAYMFKTTNESALVEEFDAASIAIPLASVSKMASWYVYHINGTDVRFLAVLDANGTVHTVFDTCAKCYKKHAGLRQEGTMLVENCCNMGCSIDDISAGTCNISCPGCHPAYLPNQIVAERVLIAKADLQTGEYMFK
jgi:uncharacterized membrane protein